MTFFEILKTSNSNLFRNKLRSFLTITAIFIGALTITLTNSIGEGAKKYFNDQFDTITLKNSLIVSKTGDDTKEDAETGIQEYDGSNTNEFGIRVLEDQDLEKIKETGSGISRVEPVYPIRAEYITTENEEKYKITIEGFGFSENFEPQLKAGEVPEAEGAEDKILLESGYEKVLGFDSADDAIGQMVEVGFENQIGEIMIQEFEVAGIIVQTLINQGSSYISQEDIEEIYDFQISVTGGLDEEFEELLNSINEGLPPEQAEIINGVIQGFQQTQIQGEYLAALATIDPDLTEEEIEELKKELGDANYSAITFEDQIELIQNIFTVIQWVLNFFGIIALVAATFGITNTLLMGVYERTREIGLMKALGMSRKGIFAIFAFEALFIGLWGSILGIITAFLVGSGVQAAVSGQDFFTALEGYQIFLFTPQAIFITIGVIGTVSFLAGTLPALKASKLNPIEALRYE
jgi:putative ABC transport system permease protein